MTIRAMRVEDIPRVMEIASGLPEAPHWTAEAYTRALDPEARPARVALVGDDRETGILAFVVAILIPPQAELETIAVARPAQRKGQGAALLAELFAVLQNVHITEVMLEVRESNAAARNFYAFNGFQETGRRPCYYSEPKEDAILLARQLPSSRSPAIQAPLS